MRLHRYDLNNRIGALRDWSEGRQRQTIQNVQKLFSGSALVYPEALVTEKAADLIPHTTRKRTKRLFTEEVEGDDIIVYPELLPKSFRKEQVLVPRSTEIKMGNTLKPERQENEENEDHPKGEETSMTNKAPFFLVRPRRKIHLTRTFRLSG